jgi:hypothetical protein
VIACQLGVTNRPCRARKGRGDIAAGRCVRVHRLGRGVLYLLAAACFAGSPAAAATHRLADGITAFVPNPEGREFTITLDVRDINVYENGPREVLLKVYDPDGGVLVREVIPDDGVTSKAYQQPTAAFDHEAWYYAFCAMQGAPPMIRWSAFSAPDRLATIPKRTFRHAIPGGKKGVYRILIVGAVDHYVTLKIDPELPYGVAGNTEMLHGHGDLYGRRYVYVPKGTVGLHIALCEYDSPRSRRVAIKTTAGQVLFEGSAPGGFRREFVRFAKPDEYDDEVLVLEVSSGPGDYLLGLTVLRDPAEGKGFRGDPAVAAVLAPDETTARAVRGGAIYHDGQVFWQPFQVRLHAWLKTLGPDDFSLHGPDGRPIDPERLPPPPGFIPLNGPYWRPPIADVLMHHWVQHRDRKVLNVAVRDVASGLRHIGPGDHIANGPFRNMGYEFSTYAFHWYRPAWRLIQQSDAPQEVKDILREAFLLCGDRLAFCRDWCRVNGNAFAHVPMALRYCSEATGDDLQRRLFDTYLDRFLTGGWGDRVGVGPSGPVQEGFAYAYHYASYVLSSWKAVLADLPDERFQAAYDRLRKWFSYTLAAENIAAGAWSSRTHYYPHWSIEQEGPFAWKGLPGPPFTVSVNDANEWFAARRRGYYVLTYHGRLSPKWMSYAHAGQAGYGGGMLCQLHVPGRGPVLASTLNGSYGEGMHPSQWRTFHIHSVVGQTADGKPLVAADSEHFDARLIENTVRSSGEVRESSVHVSRTYIFGDDDITCQVALKETEYEPLLSLWVASPLRGKVVEAYEMIPFVPVKTGSGTKREATEVTALAADGTPIGALSRDLQLAKTVVVDRGGFGVRIELEQPAKVCRGETNTVLIQMVDTPTPASKIGLTYRLVPFGAF